MSLNRNLIKRFKNVNTAEVSLPACFHHAEGSRIYDQEGKAYLDFTSGFGVTNSGWLREEIAEEILDQLKNAAYAPPWLPNMEAIELSELLLGLTPPNLVKCARAVSGADANEIIYKAVYLSRGKDEVISFKRSYHGGTHFALSISDTEKFNLPKIPWQRSSHLVEPPYCFRCPYNKDPATCHLECLDPIADLLEENKNIGVIIAEPVIGSGGVIPLPFRYVTALRQLCDNYGIFLVFDEVLTAFGRLGKMIGSESFDVQPDAITLAKGMSGGYTAIGGTVLNEELANALKKHEDISSTFAWTPLSCRIAICNINLIRNDGLPGQAAVLGTYLCTQLDKLFGQYLPEKTGDIRGIGLMIGIELVTDKKSNTPDLLLSRKLVIAAFREGLMICASWDFQVLVLMPPLNITRDEIDEGLNKLESALKIVSNKA